jgi:cytochrome c biogenesis protein CcmG/thiol:disulfide interchange protein DsbE
VILALAGIAAIAVAVLILAGDDSDTTTQGAAATVSAGSSAPALVGRDPVTGATVSLARVKRKPVVLTVWASWCQDCARQAPAIRAFVHDHRRDAVVLGLDLQDEVADARAFYERFAWTFRSIADTEGLLAARLGVETLPATFVLDRQHTIVRRLDGVASDAELEQALEEALRE